MSNSILTSTKKILGINEDYTVFDLDIMTHINSVFTTLTQLGVGPAEGFYIEDSTAVWDDFIAPEANLSAVKSYVYLRVRLLFDPPSTSYHITSLKEQVLELEWRLTVQVDPVPYPPVPIDPELPLAVGELYIQPEAPAGETPEPVILWVDTDEVI